MNAKILPRVTVAILATMTGLYPVFYYVVHSNNPGLLERKSAELLEIYFYRASFYTHITFGGVALLIGWLQFSRKIRARNLNLHRTIGKMYMVAVALSGVGGFTIAISWLAWVPNLLVAEFLIRRKPPAAAAAPAGNRVVTGL
jgi:uncharacterized membrane protein